MKNLLFCNDAQSITQTHLVHVLLDFSVYIPISKSFTWSGP